MKNHRESLAHTLSNCSAKIASLLVMAAVMLLLGGTAYASHTGGG